MKIRSLALPAITVVALLAVACVGDGETVVQTSSQNLSGVSATGTGRAFGEPDVAVVNVGVNVQRPTVEEARETAAAAQQAVIDSLRDNGVDEDDIQTVQFSVHPQYDNRNGGTGPNIVGYVVSNVVTARVRDLDSTGQVIDDVTRAGGNDAVVQGVSFTVDDPSELRAQAREQAVQMAMEQAEQLASAAGTTLGDLISISEESGNLPFGPEFGRAGADTAQSVTPIEPGEVEVMVFVNLLYAIEQ